MGTIVVPEIVGQKKALGGKCKVLMARKCREPIGRSPCDIWEAVSNGKGEHRKEISGTKGPQVPLPSHLTRELCHSSRTGK